jgi:hypothetical protein
MTAISNAYPTMEQMYDRLGMVTGDGKDTQIQSAAVTASRLVDTFLKPYVTVPLTGTVPDQVMDLTADIGASMYKRILYPTEMHLLGKLTPDTRSQISMATGWMALGISKLQEYIRSFYTLAQTVGTTLYNQNVFNQLAKDGIITTKEARAFINAANIIVKTEQETLTKTKTETDTLTKTEVGSKIGVESLTKLNTVRGYVTKKQNRIGCIESDPYSDGYRETPDTGNT